MIIWLMPVACCVPKATDARSNNTYIDFPLQQWLHERASVFHCAYFACLVTSFCSKDTVPITLFLSFFLSFFLFLSSFLPFVLSFFLPFFLPSFLSSFSRSSECWTKRKSVGIKLGLEESEVMLSAWVPLPACLLTGTCPHLSFGGVMQAHEKWKTISNTHVSIMSVFVTTDLEWKVAGSVYFV